MYKADRRAHGAPVSTAEIRGQKIGVAEPGRQQLGCVSPGAGSINGWGGLPTNLGVSLNVCFRNRQQRLAVARLRAEQFLKGSAVKKSPPARTMAHAGLTTPAIGGKG